jgi:hypothetical protein
VKLRTATADLVAREFANAAAAGAFDRAEGWAAIATFIARREADHERVRSRRNADRSAR